MPVIQPRSKKSITGFSIEIVNGWTVEKYPDGNIIARVNLDIDSPAWDSLNIIYVQENLPVDVFTDVISCTCIAEDYSPGVTYKNTILPMTNTMFNNAQTSKIALQAYETAWGEANYTAPTKLHTWWIVEGR